MSQERIVEPPRIAAWLVDLFITEKQTVKQGDTLDKFSDMALRRGIGPARRWYWRSSAKTIAGLIGRGFRTAPWLMVGTALGGALLFQLGTGHLQYTITTILLSLNHHVRPYYDSDGAAVYLSRLEDAVVIGSLLESLIAGCFVAVVAKRREVIAAMTLSFLSVMMTATSFWASVLFHHIMIEQLGASLLMTTGGIIVREIRSGATRGPSVA